MYIFYNARMALIIPDIRMIWRGELSSIIQVKAAQDIPDGRK